MLLKKAEVKSVSAILRALQTYDGCEIDVRLTKDRVVALFHDANHSRRRLVNTDFKDLEGVQTLEELIHHPQVIESINTNGKTLWIEAKEDSRSGLRKDLLYCKEVAERVENELKHSRLNLENTRIISFAPGILKHIKGIRTLRIIPYFYSASDCSILHYNHKTILNMLISLRRHIENTKRLGMNGLLFSKKYLQGLFSFFQPCLEELKSSAGKDFILGTEAQTLEEEIAYRDFVVITDYRGERKEERGEGAGPLICHRGL